MRASPFHPLQSVFFSAFVVLLPARSLLSRQGGEVDKHKIFHKKIALKC